MSRYTEKYTDFNENVRIWIHRCNHYGRKAWEMLGYDYNKKEFTFENDCYISIGCGSGKWNREEYDKIKESKNPRWEFEKHYDNPKPRYRAFLYEFFFEFKKDDYIIVPSGGEFHVYQIDSEKIFTYNDSPVNEVLEKIDLSPEKIKDADFKFFRKVKPIRVQIPRKGYATGELCSKLKYRGTTLEIKDNAAEEFKKALAADSPFSIYNKAIESLKKELYNVLLGLNPDQLESLIAWYFKKKGADIYEVLPKNYSDKVEKEDVDVLGIFEDLKLRFFVQAKAYTGSEIDLSGAISQIEKYMEYHVQKSKYTDIKWIICLTKSESEIKNFDSIGDNIRIIHGMEFAEMLLQVGLQNIDEALN